MTLPEKLEMAKGGREGGNNYIIKMRLVKPK